MPRIVVEPWQNAVNKAILAHEMKKSAKKVRRSKNKYVDIGKENRYMMWASVTPVTPRYELRGDESGDKIRSRSNLSPQL